MPERHLITGFPGFLAGRLVERLAADAPEARFDLVVEPRMLLAAKARAEQVAQRVPSFPGRWQLLPGDIRTPELGLSQATLADRTAEITDVWHLAALYDLAAPASLAYAINVDGTLHVLDLARRLPALHRLHYVSTCYVAGDRTGRVYESELDEGQGFKNHYESTKCWAEKHVRRVIPDVPVTIYRPSIVVGDAQTGETAKGDGPYFVLRLLERLPAWLPMVDVGPSKAFVNLVPVDFVIDAMVRLGRHAPAVGQTVALADPDPYTAHQVLEKFLLELGRRPQRGRVPARWVDALLRRRRVAQLAGLPREAVAYFNHEVEYDTRVASGLLAPLRGPCPAFDAYLPALVRYARNHPEIYGARP